MTDPAPNTLQLGVPAGSLKDATAALFKKAGYDITFSSRSYFPRIDDDEIECLLIRAQEMARYVENGILDAGITGHDWVQETQADVHEVCELVFSKVSRRPVRWVLCVPNDSPVQGVADLAGKTIATEAVGLTKAYLARHGVEANVEFSWGPRRSSRHGWPTRSSRSPRPAARCGPTTCGSSMRCCKARPA